MTSWHQVSDPVAEAIAILIGVAGYGVARYELR
jgi:hypothetical protein